MDIKDRVLDSIASQTIGEPKIWLHSKLAERQIASSCSITEEEVQQCIDSLINDKILKHTRRSFYLINKPK